MYPDEVTYWADPDPAPPAPVAWLADEVGDIVARAAAETVVLDAGCGAVLVRAQSGREFVIRRRIDRLWPETEVLTFGGPYDEEARAHVAAALHLDAAEAVQWAVRPPRPRIMQVPHPADGDFRTIATLDVAPEELAARHGLRLPVLENQGWCAALVQIDSGERFLVAGFSLASETTIYAARGRPAQDQVNEFLIAFELDLSSLDRLEREPSGPVERLVRPSYGERQDEAAAMHACGKIWFAPEHLAERSGLTFRRPASRPRVQEAWIETTSGYRVLLRRADDDWPRGATTVCAPRYEDTRNAWCAASQALDLDDGDIASDPWSYPEEVSPPLAAGPIVVYVDGWGSGLIRPDDDGPPVALDGGDALGNPAFLQPGWRVVFRREHTEHGPRAREVRSAPHARMER